MHGIVATDSPKDAFKDADVCLLVGAKPRGKGMERKDLLRENGPIFTPGRRVNDHAAPPDGGVVVGEGGDAGEGERRDEVDRDGPAPFVHERHARGENVAPVFERVVHHQAVVRVERGGDDAAIRGDVLPAQA